MKTETTTHAIVVKYTNGVTSEHVFAFIEDAEEAFDFSAPNIKVFRRTSIITEDEIVNSLSEVLKE
jgi:hypothetical protein